MPATDWKLTLKNAASPVAKRITRDVNGLTAALRSLASVSASAQASLSRVAPAGTAVQIRGVTSAIKEQTRALREQQALAGRAPRGSSPRPTSPRVSPLGGRATPAVRTRVEYSSTDPRALAAGTRFQERARGLQTSHNAKLAREGDRARNREQRETDKHFRGIYNSAKKNARDLERLNAQTARQQDRLRQSQARNALRVNREQSESMTSMLGVAGRVGLGIAAAVAGITTAFAGVGLSAAQAVVEVAAFRESSLVALQAVLGSSDAAGRSFRNAVTIANQTPLDTQDVIAQTQSLAVAGFQEREITPLIAASADLGAAFGNRASEGFTLALSQIRATGTLQGQELLQLSNANVSRMAVLDSVARQMNLGQGDAGRRAAMTAISQRRVSSGVGEQAALDAVRGRLDQGGQLGSFARRQSETLTGAISNARNAIFNLLVGIDFSNVPGLIAFKNVLLQVTQALQSGSPAAAALRQGIMGAANAVGGLLARAINPTTIAAGMAAVGRGFAMVQRFATAAWPIVRSFVQGMGPGFTAGIAPLRAIISQLMSGGGPSAATLALLATAARGLGTAFGFVAGSIATILSVGTMVSVAITGLAATFTGLATNVLMPVRQAFVGVGANIVGGIIDGIRNGVGALGSAVTGLGASAVDAARRALGIHSPSRVFAEVVGRQIPAGIAMGARAGAPMANDAVSGIVSPRVPQLGGAGASVSITIEVNGAGQPAETARAVRAELEQSLGEIFGQWGEAFA